MKLCSETAKTTRHSFMVTITRAEQCSRTDSRWLWAACPWPNAPMLPVVRASKLGVSLPGLGEEFRDQVRFACDIGSAIITLQIELAQMPQTARSSTGRSFRPCSHNWTARSAHDRGHASACAAPHHQHLPAASVTQAILHFGCLPIVSLSTCDPRPGIRFEDVLADLLKLGTFQFALTRIRFDEDGSIV
jgi:hypothetical protein